MQEPHPEAADPDKPRTERRRVGRVLISLALIIGLILLNRWLFRLWLDTDYFLWYLDNGALFSIVFGFVALAGAKPEESIGLISINPASYLEAVLGLTTWPQLAMAATLDAAEYGRSVANAFILVPLSFILLAGVWLFLLVGAPLQYFIHIVCGAPGRAIRDSAGIRSYWIVGGDRVRMEVLKSHKGELPKELASYDDLRKFRAELSKVEESARQEGVTPTAVEELVRLRHKVDESLRAIKVTEVRFEDQPLKLTAAFSALILWVVGQFVG